MDKGNNNKLKKSSRQHHSHDSADMISICLSDGPKTIRQIEQNFIELPRRFGMFIELFDQESVDRGHLTESLRKDLEKMIKNGWVEKHGEFFQLTKTGEQKSADKITGLKKFGNLIRKAGSPQTVGKVSLVFHLLLAAIKLPAALISGSIGLLNDAADTFLDGISSILVLLGIRFKKERLANAVLILLMLITGSLALYKSIQRFFIPLQPQVDWFTFFSAIISAAFCAGLYFYQRFVGLRSGNFSLITQSVDSRNHVIVAASVTVGLIAALLKFTILDTIVGFFVALLILKSAVELALELLKSLRDEEADLSRYEMNIAERYAEFKRNQLRGRILYLINRETGLTEFAVKEHVGRMLDFSSNPALRGVGLSQEVGTDEDITAAIQYLCENGWINKGNSLSLTASGRAQLNKYMHRSRPYHQFQH